MKRGKKGKFLKSKKNKNLIIENKKDNTWIFVFLGVVVLFSILFNFSQMNLTGNVITGYQGFDRGQFSVGAPGQSTGAGTTVRPTETTWKQLLNSDNPFSNVFHWIFGTPVMLQNAVSSIVVVIAIWLLMFFTFADIVLTFSSFGAGTKRAWIAWVIAFLISIIAANIGIVTKIALVATTIFAGIAIVGTYLGLAAALVVFILLNFGITKLSKWMLKRKALIFAMSAESGGKKIVGGVKGFSEITKELAKFGKSP